MALTVTATQGGSPFNGILLSVRVLTGAKARTSQTGATAHAGNTTVSLTTTVTGSVAYGAGADSAGTAFTTILGSTTQLAQDNDATNGATYATWKGAAATGTPGATNFGWTNPGATDINVAAEILASGTIAVDGSSPADVQDNTHQFVTTASFTPPAGSLLVACVASDSAGTGLTIAISDTASLTWTQLIFQDGPSFMGAGVWVADAPSGTTPPAPPLVQAKRRQPARLPRLSSIRPGKTPGSGVAFVPPPTPLVQAKRRQPARRPGLSSVRPGKLPGSGVPFVPPPTPLTQARRAQPPRRPRSSITAGKPPRITVPAFITAARRQLQRKPRSFITGLPPVAVTAAAVLPAPRAVQAIRRQPPRLPRGRVLTGMTPGSGVPFVPPAPVITITVRRQPLRRPRGSITGPLAPPAVAVTVLPAPRIIQAGKNRILPLRRGRLTGPLAPGIPPVTPIVPGPLRATRRPPPGRSQPLRLQRALAASSFVPPVFSIGALTAADAGTSTLTASGASSTLTAQDKGLSALTATDARTGGPS